MAGVALHPAVPRHGVLRRPGDHLASEQLAASLPQYLHHAVPIEDVGVLPPFGRHHHLHAGAHLHPVAFRFPDRLVVLRRYLPVLRRPRPAVAVLAGDLGLVVHVLIGVAVPHDVPGGVAVDALHPGRGVDVRSYAGEVAGAARHRRPREPPLARHHRVVAVVEPLVGEGDPAGAVVAAGADLAIRELLHGMARRVGRFPPQGRLRPPVGRVVVVGEVAGGAPRGVARAEDLAGLLRHVALGAELPVQLPGDVVELGHGFQVAGHAARVVDLPSPAAEEPVLRPLPGEVRVLDHAGGGVHQVGLHPLQLVAVAGAAALLPVLRRGRVLRAVHAQVGRVLVLLLRIAAMTRDAVGVALGDLFELRVAGDALADPGAAGGAADHGQERRKQENRNSATYSSRPRRGRAGEGAARTAPRRSDPPSRRPPAGGGRMAKPVSRHGARSRFVSSCAHYSEVNPLLQNLS